MPRNTPTNVTYLEDHGPTPYSELPTEFSISDRLHGAARLKVEGAGNLVNPEAIAYLFEEHSADAVVRAFVDANPEFVERASYQRVIQHLGGYGSAFKAAGKEHLDAPKPWWERGPAEAEEETAAGEGGHPGLGGRIRRLLSGAGGDGDSR